MSKKLWATLSAVMIAAMVLAACGGAAAQPTATPTTPAPVTITVWHQWDGKYLDAIKAVFDSYTAAHPNVTIDLSKPDDVSNALSVAIPAGQGPDIIGWANDKIGTLALGGNIVALNDLGVDEAFLNSTFEPAAVKGVIWQGKIWALPESQEGIALVYNKDIVTADYMPKDLNDLLAKAEAFQKAFPDKVLVCNQGFGGSDAYHVAPIYFGFGVPSYVDDTGKVFVNTPEMVKGGDFLLSLSKFSLKENTYDICNAALKEGKVGMWWTGPWAIAGIEENKVNYGILALGKPFVGIKTLMISKNAADRGTAAVALDIIKFFTNAENEKKMALANKTIPSNTAAIKDSEVAALGTLVGFGAALNAGIPMANTPYADAQWGPVGDASAAIWNGTQQPAEALAAAATAIETKVAEMK